MDSLKKKSMMVGIIVLGFSVSALCSEDVSEVRAKIKPWTFLVYMAADNNLAPYVQFNQRGMEKVGTNDNINILMFVSTHLAGQPKVSKKYVVNKNQTTLVGTINNADSGSESTLITACKWALQSYPSQQFALILWDHGNAWRQEKGACFDDTTRKYLTDVKMANALKAVYQYRKNKKIDIVGFDACLMATLEIAYAMAPYATYLVASEETISDDGFDYANLLAPFAKGTLSADTFAKIMVTTYDAYYKNPETLLEGDYCLSAIDLTKIVPLVQNVNSVAQTFNNIIKTTSKKNLINMIVTGSSSNNCISFEDPTMLDLYSFYVKNRPHYPR